MELQSSFSKKVNLLEKLLFTIEKLPSENILIVFFFFVIHLKLFLIYRSTSPKTMSWVPIIVTTSAIKCFFDIKFKACK